MPVNYRIIKTKNYFAKPDDCNQTAQKAQSSETSSLNNSENSNSGEQFYPTLWNIFTKDNTLVGNFKFSENPERGRIRLEYDFDKLSNREDLKLLFHEIIRCAFTIKDVFSIEILLPDTKESKEIIDFLPYKKSYGENGSCIFHVNDTVYMSFYMMAGVLIGLGVGTLLSITGIGVLAGFVIGTAIGFSLDNSIKKHRQMIEADLYPEELYKKYKKK